MSGLTKKGIRLHINRQSFLYFVALDLYLLDFLVSINARFGFWLDAIPRQYTIMTISVIALLFIKMINDRYTRAELERIIIFGALFAIWIITASDYTYLPLLFMFIVASKNIDFNKIVLNYLVVHALMFCITVGGCLLGLISNFEKSGENGTIIKCLGYTTYYAPIILCMITYLFVYYKKNNLKLWHVFFISIIDIYIFIQCDVQMPFFITIALLIMAYIMKLIAKKGAPLNEKPVLGFIARNVFLVGAIIAFALSLMYNADSEFWANLNSFLTNRLSLSQTALSTYGVGLFGQSVTWSYVHNNSYIYPDSGYIQYAIKYGILYIMLMILLFRNIGKCAIKTNDRYLLLILIMLSVYSVVNPSMFLLSFSPWLLMGGGLIYGKEKDKVKVTEKRKLLTVKLGRI